MHSKQTVLIVIGILGILSALAISTWTGSWRMPMGQSLRQMRTGEFSGRGTDLLYEEDSIEPAAPMMGKGVGMMGGGVTGAPDVNKYDASLSTLPMPYPIYGDDALQVADRAYQKSSYHSVVVTDVDGYVRQMKEYILSIDGRVLSLNQGVQGDYSYGYIMAKVPVSKFEEATGRVTSETQKVISANIDAQDITGQKVGTDTRLQDLLDQQAVKQVEYDRETDAVRKRQIQVELDRLARQISDAQRQVGAVDQQIEYATITVNASDSEAYFNPEYTDVKTELKAAWQSLKNTVKMALKAGIWVSVFSILWLPVVLFVRWIMRRGESSAKK